jgi:hypothetical protein
MKKVLYSLLCLGVIGFVGCKEGTSQAPPKPGQPGDANEPRTLTVTSPGNQTITQNLTDELTVSIDRDNFNSPVRISLENLPSGVEVVTENMTIPPGQDSLTVTLKASPTATAVSEHLVRVIARPVNEEGLKEAVTDFKLEVKNQ